MRRFISALAVALDMAAPAIAAHGGPIHRPCPTGQHPQLLFPGPPYHMRSQPAAQLARLGLAELRCIKARGRAGAAKSRPLFLFQNLFKQPFVILVQPL
jgi:hypothetical protein